MARKLIVEIVGDASSLEKSFKRAERSTTQFNRNIEKTGRGVKGFGLAAAAVNTRLLGAGGLVLALKQSVDAASDFNEQMSKTNAVFGENAAEVVAWSKTLTSSFGLSQRQALTTASSFGALFKPIGLVGDEAVRQSEVLTQLGGDLASFYGGSVQDALDAVRSGLVGEAEPLRAYSVLLSETRVQQQALVDTGKRHASELTNQEKALARIKIILQDTQVAQGDYKATQHDLAQETKTLQGNIDDLSVALGQNLVPALTLAVGGLNKLAGAIRKVPDAKNWVKDKLGPLGFVTGAAKWVVPEVALPLKALDMLTPDKAKGGPSRSTVWDRARAAAGIFPKAAAAPPTPVADAKRTAEQRNQWWDAMIGRKIDRVQDVASLQGQLASLRSIAALVKQRLAITKDVTRQLNLEDLLLTVTRQQIGVREQQQAVREQMAAQAAAAAQAARDEALAWADFAVEKAAATKGLKDDLKAAQDRLKLLEKQAGVGKKTAAEARAIWEQQQEINRIRKEMGRAEKGFATRFKPMNVSAFIQSMGLGLTLQQMRKLAVALAQLGPGGTLPTGRSAAFAGAGGVHISGDVHISGVQNAKEMEAELHKRAKRRAAGRRGN